MKILVIDPAGVALDWCMRAQNDGHKISWWMRDTPKTEWIGRGLVPRVRDWEPHIASTDLVFLPDNTHWLHRLDSWREKGVPIFGPTDELADLELDRTDGQDLLSQHGIDTLPYKTFDDYDQAIAFVKKEMRRFVSKPSDEADKALSYVAKSPADLVYMLQRWKKLGKLKSPFILQDFVEGCEMAVGGWFGPGGFNEGWCENFEFKKLMNGDIGVATGEQGTVIRYVKKSKLADQVLKPLSGWLERKGYVGYIDVNCIIDDKGKPWPLEFTCRPGWPTFNIQMALLKGDVAEWMVATLEGKDPRNWILDQVALGVVMTIPDYPYSHLTRKEVVGIPLYGLTPSIAPNIHPCEMMLGEAPHEVGQKIVDLPSYVSAGDYILVTTGTGETVLEAKQMAMRIMKRLKMPNSPMYRTDIGDRLKKQLPSCQKFGYATGLKWDTPSS